LAQACLLHGRDASRLEITALSQAKLLYAKQTLQACADVGAKVFGSIIDYDAIEIQPEFRTITGLPFLRRDHNYLFERFYYYLEDLEPTEMGIVVFDELEKSQSLLLLDQMTDYFIKTKKGQERSNLIIPEPFFVHSDLTIGIQVVDLVAYLLSWGFRIRGMTKPSRPELEFLVSIIRNMRVISHRYIPSIGPNLSDIWSIAWIQH